MIEDPDRPLRLGRVAATIPVSDIALSYAALNETFGFEKVFENGDPVGFMILARDDAELHLTLCKSHRGGTHNVAHLMVSDADEACRRCEARGLRIIRRLADKDYGLRAFVFADRDGNRFDVAQEI